MIKVPDGPGAVGDPYMPEIRRLYWLHQPLLDPRDPKTARPCVVVGLPTEDDGVITVVQRSSTEANGQFHRRQSARGLNKDGWFSRLRVVQAVLWTPETARAINLLLDEETFSYILRDFNL